MPGQTVTDSPVAGSARDVPSLTDRRVPGATYRLQFHAGFTFRDATTLVPYLHALGITDVYASPFLQAVAGSPHGYDVTDPTSLNRELGTDEDFRAFVAALHAHGMGQVLDVVPNHMGIARSANRWWQDVLENGPSSPFARVFDIDWAPLKPELKGKVLLPILGDQYGAVLERQEIRLAYESGAFWLHYFETTLPISPHSYPSILKHDVDRLTAALGDSDPDLQELLSISTSLERLPARTDLEPARLVERQREKEIGKRRLARLTAESAPIRQHVEANVRAFNGTPGHPASFDLLDRLLGEQGYRLAHWRVASEEINYRRFFDINELAALRMEDPEVFELASALVFRLLEQGAITGLRIDHVDGLYDPGDYLRRLQEHAREKGIGAGPRPLFVVVEKILAPGEALPADWPVDGTTGYEFANMVNGLFVDRMSARAFDEIYTRFTGAHTSFADIAYRNKKLIMQGAMASEINALAHQLNMFSERNRHYRDFTLYSLAHAIREIIACFPVYRTYVPAGDAPVSDRDRKYIQEAVEEAKRRNLSLTGLVFDFIGDLLLKRADYIPEADREEYLRFVTKFQQITSPVTAKGIEDTALYVYTRLLSLNEVGGSPDRFGVSPHDLHAWFARRQREWPSALSATSTHDTKRSEDIRARLDVLSEIPGAWKQVLQHCARVNRKLRGIVNGQAAPDRQDEYFLYQTIVGAWPLELLDAPPDPPFVDRMVEYMTKALREAKRHTSWLNPHAEYEEAVTGFLRRILDPATGAGFLAEVMPLVSRTAHAGLWNSLSQTVIKIAAPGVPDFYQGTELWDFSLVDPDNRRPVDYARRQAAFESLASAGGHDGPLDDSQVATLVSGRLDGRLKLYAIGRALAVRSRRERLFREGAYVPLQPMGPRAAHIFAFARVLEREAALVIVPRLTTPLCADATMAPVGSVWQDTTIVLPPSLPAMRFEHAFTRDEIARQEDGSLRVADALRTSPVALLVAA
jgi:(1->4)-alpha-D-glucan 1-alpha-D-glucosylmutase